MVTKTEKSITMKDVFLKRLEIELPPYEELLASTADSKYPDGNMSEVIRICHNHFDNDYGATSAIADYCGCTYPHVYNTCRRKLIGTRTAVELASEDPKAKAALDSIIAERSVS